MATNNAINVATAATGTVLQGAGVGTAPTFSTATYPSTTTSQQILYSTATNVVGQLTTANSAIAATNSSGTLGMRALSVVKQVFTTTGTYTPTSGMIYCDIICIGGGGAGAGAATTGAGTTSGGGGGGGGEYAQGTFSAATIGASQSVTIGAAGTGNSGATGGNGGNTSVGSTIISANGGTGGTTAAAAVAVGQAGGLGGTGGTGGTIRTPGYNGTSFFSSVGGGSLVGGDGANSQYGAGGLGTTVNTNGNVGLGNGSGGSSGNNFINQGAARTGGNGTKGIVIVTEYVIA